MKEYTAVCGNVVNIDISKEARSPLVHGQIHGQKIVLPNGKEIIVIGAGDNCFRCNPKGPRRQKMLYFIEKGRIRFCEVYLPSSIECLEKEGFKLK